METHSRKELIMDLREYQKMARSTAIYLNIENTRMLYPALGIVGECGEVAEKIKKSIRDDNWEMTPDRTTAIINELGDCCWYLANICCDTDYDLHMIYEMRGSYIAQLVHNLLLPQLAIHMSHHATSVATMLERWYYIYNCRLGDKDLFGALPIHLSHIIACIGEVANKCDFTLEEICTANIAKLMNRQKNGKLHGEGDNR